MTDTLHDEFLTRLNRARAGGGVLFCGAGFSADCLAVEGDDTLGTGARLSALFNKELAQEPPLDLQFAARTLEDKIGAAGLRELLRKSFTISQTTQDLADILRFPWKVIYTTNYDDAI